MCLLSAAEECRQQEGVSPVFKITPMFVWMRVRSVFFSFIVFSLTDGERSFSCLRCVVAGESECFLFSVFTQLLLQCTVRLVSVTDGLSLTSVPLFTFALLSAILFFLYHCAVRRFSSWCSHFWLALFCPPRSLGVTELCVFLSVPPVCIGTVSNACVTARLEYVWRCVCVCSQRVLVWPSGHWEVGTLKGHHLFFLCAWSLFFGSEESAGLRLLTEQCERAFFFQSCAQLLELMSYYCEGLAYSLHLEFCAHLLK